MSRAGEERPDLVRFVARDRFAERVQQPAPRAEVVLVDGETPVIRIYDVIDSWGGYWGVSSQEVAAALDEIPDGTATVEVHLNSPGGEATEGVAIANLLRQYPSRIVAVVDGLAASAASMVAMGAAEVVMMPSSQMMIHDASGGAWGNADFFEQTARALHHLSDSYAAAYAGKAGGDVATWRDLMRAETWYSPAEAVAAGLADRAVQGGPANDNPAAAVARHDLRIFTHAGRANAPAPKTPVASAAGPRHTPKGGPVVAFTDKQLTTLRQKIGVADDADETTILAGIEEALAEQTRAAAAAVLPEGHVSIPAAQLADMQAGAAAGQAAQARLNAGDRDRFLDSVAAKFLASNRQAWAAEYDRNSEGTRAHFATAPDLLEQSDIGHAGKAEGEPMTAEAVRETPAYKNWRI